MKIIFILCFVSCALFLTGCQVGYLVKSSYYQLSLLSKKETVEKALNDPKVDAETKRKILLVQEVKEFAEEKLGLAHTSNYDSFVLLDDKYVSYAVTASPKDKLQAYLWKFPIVGAVPYKGFFKKDAANEEAAGLAKQNLDVSVRGVSAYSTLGWFSDPLLSSMTAYDDADLVDTVIHETTHATLYIKSNADFNERFAMFVGGQGTEEFYKFKEGQDSLKIKRVHLMAEDTKIFGEFISQELVTLEEFYKRNQGSKTLNEDRQKAFDQIKKDFTLVCQPKLKTDNFNSFSKMALNNAVLVGYKTYYQDLGIFSEAFKKLRTWSAFFAYFKTLKDVKEPEKELRKFISTP